LRIFTAFVAEWFMALLLIQYLSKKPVPTRLTLL
jgi:hypothetical protein